MIASHTERLVDRYWRDSEGIWRHDVVTSESGGRVPVPYPAAELTLDEFYAGVAFHLRLRRMKEQAPA